MKKRTKKPRRVAVWGFRTKAGEWWHHDGTPWATTSKQAAHDAACYYRGYSVRRIGWLTVYVRGTGHPLGAARATKYIGTVQLEAGDFVAHVYAERT